MIIIMTVYSQSHLGWHFRMLFQSSKLKARTSLFSETWQKRETVRALSFELSKMAPQMGLAVFNLELKGAAVCCSVLQCVAVCCSVLQCVAVCCSVLQYNGTISCEYDFARKSANTNLWNVGRHRNAHVMVRIWFSEKWGETPTHKVRILSMPHSPPPLKTGTCQHTVKECVIVCCSVLQCAAVWCSVSQCAAICCSENWNLLTYSRWVCWSVLQCAAMWCSVLQCAAVCCGVLQCVLQCAAVCCNIL